jgi:hypothetical protein
MSSGDERKNIHDELDELLDDPEEVSPKKKVMFNKLDIEKVTN